MKKVKYALTEHEQQYRLKNDSAIRQVPPMAGNNFVRFNSTYFEIFNPQISMLRMILMLVSVIIICGFLPSMYSDFQDFVQYIHRSIFDAFLILFMYLILFSVLFASIFFNIFTSRDYRLRFNRKTRTVNIKDLYRKELTIPFDELIFTCSKSSESIMMMAYHFDEEGEVTMIPFQSFGTDRSAEHSEALGDYYPYIINYWVFIVEYMEGESVEELSQLVKVCYPIDRFFENPYWSFLYSLRMFTEGFLTWWYPSGYVQSAIFLPVSFPTRMFNALFCRRNTWSKTVQAASIIAEDDPVNLSAATNPTGLKKFRYGMSYLNADEAIEYIALPEKIRAQINQKRGISD